MWEKIPDRCPRCGDFVCWNTSPTGAGGVESISMYCGQQASRVLSFPSGSCTWEVTAPAKREYDGDRDMIYYDTEQVRTRDMQYVARNEDGELSLVIPTWMAKPTLQHLLKVLESAHGQHRHEVSMLMGLVSGLRSVAEPAGLESHAALTVRGGRSGQNRLRIE